MLSRPRSLAVLVFWFFVVVAAVPAGAAEPTWQMLEAPRFTVFSQLSEEKTHAWAEEFSQFTEELLHLFNIVDANLPPLTVVIFARDRDFTPYKGLRPDKKGPRDIAGFFKRRDTWSVVGLAGGAGAEEVRSLIFHEGVHWASSAHPAHLPAWLEEGLAEVYSTFQQRGDKVRWGAAIDSHVQLLRQEPLLPLERMLFVDRSSPLFNESDRVSIFYAQSWLFVHYTLFGTHRGDRQALDGYLRNVREGTSMEEAFRAAFGGDYRLVERELRAYLRSGRFMLRDKPAAASRLTGVQVVAAPAHRVEAALALLAIGPDTYGRAEMHARRAIDLAPDQPAGYEVRAALARETSRHDDAVQACARAVQLGSRDPGTLLLRTEHLLQHAGWGEMTGAAARELADIFLRAIASAPSLEAAYVGLARVLPKLTTPARAEIDALKEGARRFPRNGDVILSIAYLLGNIREFAQAREVLAAARQRGFSEYSRDFAEELERRWAREEAWPRLEALVQARDFKAAVALYDGILPQLRGTPEYAPAYQARRALVAQAQVQDAEVLVQDGQPERARELLERAIASEDLPPADLQRAEEIRAGLEAAR